MDFVVTGEQTGGSAIPEAVAMEAATEEVDVAVLVVEVTEGIIPEKEAAVAPEVVVGVRVASTEVVVQSPEIQDATLIRSAPMAEATMTRHGGLELLADDLVDPATVAPNLESMRHAEQWMKVRCHTLSSRIP
jgi:hypothetical protein